MRQKNFILATAGHVDHGKSALVKALTGTDPDRLPEEKMRGVTIDLGFAQLRLPSPNDSEESYNIGIIDVPGHEDFVRNMVAGVGAIDLGLLVVAADDGWMPQTEEHLQILNYLDVRRVVVALTKIDLAKARRDIEAEIRAKLEDSPFASAAIVQTSIADGGTLNDLRGKLAREFSSLTPSRDLRKPRLFVDRAFSLRGIGTVVTGTLTGGKLCRGDSVVVQPANLPARIRALQNHNRDVAEIGPGTRAALNVPDLSVAHHASDRGVRRGDIITCNELGNAHATVDAFVTRLARGSHSGNSIRHGTHVRVHHGSGNFAARIFFRTGAALAPGESAVAQLRFESPLFAFVGDRFVVRDCAEQQTLAGGIVLDVEATAKRFRTPEQTLFLKSRACSPLQARAFVQTQVARDHVASRAALLVKSCFSAEEVSAALEELVAAKQVFVRGDFVAEAQWWTAAIERAFHAIDAEHKAHPQHAGLGLAQLRNLFRNETPEMFDALISDLCERGAVRVGDSIKRAAHRPALPGELQSAGAGIRRALAEKPFDPPSRKELAKDSQSQQALRFFVQNGEVTEVSDDVVLSSDAFKKMRDAVVEFIRRQRSASVGELRESLGSSRRIMVPFLECMDREGVTRRLGDKRVLAQSYQGAALSKAPN